MKANPGIFTTTALQHFCSNMLKTNPLTNTQTNLTITIVRLRYFKQTKN